jgi:hypothetical protein
MTNEISSSADEVTAEVTEDPGPPRRDYEVVNELFKRERTWAPGEVIDLDERTAAAFLETGDIKEIQ